MAPASVPPATAPPPLPASPPVAEASPAIQPGWRSALARWLEAHKVYPDQARRNAVEGRVAVRVTVERDGRVSELALVRGSGSSLLDDAALAFLRGASVPPFPAGMSQDRVTMIVAIAYRLER